ncbi:RNA polymerase sigma factor [Pontibacter akesuensis]|uniref:RNA polymerase sigma-70 factor, ECF subfamily n=1 Tax=Pontibacter akesuensis TaxID=388950 RepID=A0A1I7IBH0_9BACT|nr:sigma-70 family RNA polymerase sigma factor [Pontibacter akesuensis]GHA66220.1 DNA-directed RNA polymerase sigma-70 factor [Pontibacter akesuensis]SFU70323.1 RNA polymerase sigma-70 factor, ECF subfamily [Pontibacter akesuensis]
MTIDFYNRFIRENTGIINKICRAYTDTDEDYEDYFQEVCLQLWRSHSFFEDKSAVATWVYRVALNVCLTHFKKAKKRVETGSLKEIDMLRTETDATEAEQFEQLYKAIKKLKEIDRAIIILYLEDKSYKEIAEILGIKTNHVGVKVNRIKNTLKQLIHG